jgi:hypothetical protein
LPHSSESPTGAPPANPALHHYASFTLRTTLPLPTLPAATRGTPDTLIEVALASRGAPPHAHWQHHWRDGDDVVLSLARDGADYWLRFPDLADFLLQTGPCRVLAWPEADTDATTLEHLLVDQVLPRLLAHRHRLMVHGSALAIGARHALFVGASGWGKSTLAGLLEREGHVLHSDDCVELSAEGGRHVALSTYPSLRLNADSLEALFPSTQSSSPVAAYSEKRRVPQPSETAAPAATPVDALYVLCDPADAGEHTHIQPLSPAQACQALIRHSFRLDLGDRAANAAHFAQCSAAARAIPAFSLSYPRDYALGNRLVRDILDHLSQLPPPGAPR